MLSSLNSEQKFSIAHPVWASLALLILTMAAYSSVVSLDFVTFDDPQYILDNPQVNQGLTWSGAKWAFTTGHASNWHPVTWLSHMLDVELFGLNAGMHHAMNLLIHIINTLLLFMFLQRITGATGRSALVAALFSLHPLHVESVVWISERKDVLSTLFFILTLWAYSAYVNKPALSRYLAVFVLLALGLMSKPMLVTTPFVLLLLDIWPLQRFKLSSPERSIALGLIREKLPLFALIITSSVITYLVQHEGGAVNSLSQAAIGDRITNVLVAYIAYMQNMAWPTGLAVLYPIPKTIPLWQPLGALVLLCLFSFAVLKFARRFPYLPVGWFWYLGTLVPVIGMVQVGTHAMADRYTYIPLIGLFFIIAWGGYDLLVRGSSKRVPVTIIVSLGLIGLGTATWVQVQHWSDAKTLWTRALNVTSGNFRAHASYGSLLAEEGRQKEAVVQFTAAVKIQPNYAEAHNKLGVAFAAMGRHEEAVLHYREALKYRPDMGMANTNLGNALVKEGHIEEALTYYDKALQQNRNDPLALNSLGSALDDLGRVDEAIDLYRKALDINPRLSAAHNNLAAAFVKKGQIDDAIIEIESALQIESDNATYHYNYAMLLSHTGDTEMARKHLKITLSINPENEGARQALQSIEER